MQARLSRKIGSALALILSHCFLQACSTSTKTFQRPYFEASYQDYNRAPASMTPPANAGEGQHPLDPVYMRTQADYHFAIAEAHSFEGNHHKAVESLKMVLIYDQESAQLPLRLAAEYVKLGMLSEALEYAEIAKKKNPKLIDARILLGGLYSTLKAYDKALTEYQEVLKLNPDNIEAPLYIGGVYAEQKKFDKAAQMFESMARRDSYPHPHLIQFYLGRIRAEQKGEKYQRAAENAFKKALELKPDHLESLLALGEMHARRGDSKSELELYRLFQRDHGPDSRLAEILVDKYLEAENLDAAYDQLVILEKESEDSLNIKVRMALVLIEKKDFPSAVEKLQEVLRAVPESDKIRFYLAAVYEEMKDNKNAIKHFKRIPSESPFYAESILHASYLMKQLGLTDDALDLVRTALEKRKDIPQFYPIYASLIEDPKDYPQTLSKLQVADEMFPENVQIKFFLGMIHDKLGNKEKVLESMEKVVELDPNHVQGLNYLAFTLAEKGLRLEKAESLVRRALELEPNDGYIMDTLGWILYKQGRLKESIKVLEAAHQAVPDESIIAEHLGDAYYRHALVSKAREMYIRAVEVEVDESKIKEIRAKITAIDNQELKLGSAQQRQPASIEPAK
ncbi:MAG: tetratricopeptide repeat protein [Proteobacteria bacterium]|jgi:tetratricopeptide (TPR) repeat protein|nr:tetratricopeptide repeat protein [Pseudomonadota bacterium]